MSFEGNLSSYVKKLGHPLKEIRERALQLLVAKLKLGWKMEDELGTTRELMEMLLAWFHIQKPSFQQEALILLLTLIKTKAGNYVVKEYGVRELIINLYSIKHKLDPDTEEVFEDLIDTLRFLGTIESNENIAIPRLNLQSVSSLSSEKESYGIMKTLNEKLHTANDSSSLNENCNQGSYELQDCIEVLLFPWVDLCQSDAKTFHLVEDTFRLLKSTRRCCRFICDVFLHDFPPEIFLNRPSIVQNLLSIITDTSSTQVCEALYVLLCLTKALRMRLYQLICPELAHVLTQSTDNVRTPENEDRYQAELQQIAGDIYHDQSEPVDEAGVAALKQLPAPIYALDVLHALLSTLTRNVLLEDPTEKKDLLQMVELNISVSLLEHLISLLLECVTEQFWNVEHSSKTQRDIAHKSCMTMRLLADLLEKYKRSFNEDSTRSHHRTAWLRLLRCGEKLLSWTRQSLLPPSALALALQSAQIDPALEIIYPEFAKEINDTLQSSNIARDQEFIKKYKEFSKLISYMDPAVQFMKNKSCRNSKKVLDIIKESLPLLEFHQTETYLHDVGEILLVKIKEWNLDDNDWCLARNITLTLMAHNCIWVQVNFYKMLSESVIRVFTDNECQQSEKEKDLYLLCDVGILTEICCQGLESQTKQVASSASDIMMYLLRGRLLLSEGCWWRLLASLLPIIPLLHCFAMHDTPLGQAICKSLEADIAECMGIPTAEVLWGLVRLLYVKCPAVQMDAALLLCQSIVDEKYLPQRELIRPDVLISALRRVETHDFNVDYTVSPSKLTQINAVLQVLEVLKQDIVFDENGMGFTEPLHNFEPILEPSLRLSTLQQLSVLLRQPQSHEIFIKQDGLQIVVTLLRMSLLVDDYLAFPDCALSCVSIFNSVCYNSRHLMSKISDLPALLSRVILIYPSNESMVAMASQVLSLTAWSGFALQELDRQKKKVIALPNCVTRNTHLPFPVQTYWTTSPNAVHSSVEWLLSEDCWRSALRVRWACAWGGVPHTMQDASAPPISSPAPGPLSLRLTAEDVTKLQTSCPLRATSRALLMLQNATTHNQVNETIAILEGYTKLIGVSAIPLQDLAALPWNNTMMRFLTAAPASPRDVILLISLLKFIIQYADNVPDNKDLTKWMIALFMESNESMVTLLSRRQLFPQQSEQDSIEITQLHKHIVKVLLRCVIILDREDNYDATKIESLLKILLSCLEKIDLRNFHMLGYLNEVIRCVRYTVNSRHCKPGEELTMQSMSQMRQVVAGCVAGGGGCKGEACRLDAVLTMLVLVRRAHEENMPVQSWGECWSGEAVNMVCACGVSGRPELRATALRLLAALAYYTQLLPHLQQAVPGDSLCKYAVSMYSEVREADVVRAAAVTLLAALSSRSSPQTTIHEQEIFEHINEYNFLEVSLELLADFSSGKKYKARIERNVPLSVLDKRAELEVRASKGSVFLHTLSSRTFHPSPTPALVSALAGCLYNMCALSECPTDLWNERGLFRLLFRCTWCSEDLNNLSASTVADMCTNARRALVRFANNNTAVRATLAGTRDCLHAMLYTLRPLEMDELNIQKCAEHTQGLMLLGVMLAEQPAVESVWSELRNNHSDPFFCLILQSLQSDNLDFREAGLYCLSQLMQSIDRCKTETSDVSLKEFFDSILAPQATETFKKDSKNSIPDEFAGGESFKDIDDCLPEYMAECICKCLIRVYRNTFLGPKKVGLSKDDSWTRLCSCLASILCASRVARAYAIHAGLAHMLLLSLQTVRDHLSIHGKPADVIRNCNTDPILRMVYWILLVVDCSMIDCEAAKESFAENGISNSLNKLWPWLMMTEELREATIHLLQTFTNNCPKAWVSMCACVGSRNLISEVCAVAQREAALASRTHPTRQFIATFTTLRHCAPHHHCRAIMLKSDVLSTIYRLRCMERGRQSNETLTAWAKLAEAACRHADGAAKLLELRVTTVPQSARDALLPAIAHAAHHHRATFLQSPELLELLTTALASGEPTQVFPAARAVWTLAANNHKAKMTLRNAGVSSAVSCALQRLQRSRRDQPILGRALQLLAYTDSVLNIT